jgi:hypothetical protein
MLTTFLSWFLSVDTICAMVSKLIAKLLKYASERGGDAWEKAKGIILQINTWTSLFLQVYEDDNLTKDEEELIAHAIKERTSISKITEIAKK